MDLTPDFAPYIQLSEKDLPPSTPHLSLTIRAPIELARTLPYRVHFTLRRLARGDATDARPCVVRWDPAVDAFSPAAPAGLVLLRHGWIPGGYGMVRGLVRVPVVVDDDDDDDDDHGGGLDGGGGGEGSSSSTRGRMESECWQRRWWWELAAPGDEVSVTATLPEGYYRAMGSSRYGMFTLVYPGAEVGEWGWGTVGERRAEEKAGGTAKMVIPGGARINFAAVYNRDELPWPERDAYEAEHGFERANAAQEEWHEQEMRKRAERPRPERLRPFEPSDRVPGAPHFTVAVEGPTTVKSYELMNVTLNYTHHGVTGTDGNLQSSGARPVTFRDWALTSDNHFVSQLRRRRGGPEGEWEACALVEHDLCRWAIYDEDDVEVYVGQRAEDFASLRPGESRSKRDVLNDPAGIDLPRDSLPGDVFRYRVIRSEVDWWDWGTMEDHRDTAVKLPCYLSGDVTDPKDNGGRPKLVVPASEWFEFTLVE